MNLRPVYATFKHTKKHAGRAAPTAEPQPSDLHMNLSFSCSRLRVLTKSSLALTSRYAVQLMPLRVSLPFKKRLDNAPPCRLLEPPSAATPPKTDVNDYLDAAAADGDIDERCLHHKSLCRASSLPAPPRRLRFNRYLRSIPLPPEGARSLRPRRPP